MSLRLLSVAALALLTGCTQTVSTLADFQRVRSGYLTDEQSAEKKRIAADYAARVQAGAPQMAVAVTGTGGASGLVLVSQRGPHQIWRSPDNVTLTTQDGLLIATRSLANDLMSADVEQSRALILAGRSGQGVRVHRYLDGSNKVVIRSFVCDVAPQGETEISYDNRTFRTLLVHEDCTNPEYELQNRYWLSQGQIIQSQQWAGLALGTIVMRRVMR